MFCCYCGKNIPDDAKFCGYCGKSTPADIKKTDSAAQRPALAARQNTGFAPAAPECKNPSKSGNSGYRLTQYGSSAPTVTYKKEESDKISYQEIFNYNWRSFVSSPMVIITVILYCILIVYNIAAAQDSLEIAYEILDELQMDDLTSAMMSMQFVSFLPGILTCLGMIFIMADGFRSKTVPVSSAGLHIIRTTMIILVSIGGVAVAFVILAMLGIAGEAGAKSDALGAMMLGVMLGLGFVIFYVCSVFTVMNNALYGISYGRPDSNKVILLAVFQFISVGLLMLTILGGEELNFATVLQMAVDISLGIVLVMYNGMLENTYYMQIQANNPR